MVTRQTVAPFYNLQIDSSNYLTVSTDIEVGNNLTVGSTGMIYFNESSASVEGSVTNNGFMASRFDVANGETVNFLHIQDSAASTDKYAGVAIEATGGDLGSTLVRVGGNDDCTADDGSNSYVQRCFEIVPTTQNDATISYFYNASEANGNVESGVNVYHWNGTSWVVEGGTYSRSSGSDPRYSQVTAVSAYSPFVLDDSLPTVVTSTIPLTASQSASALNFGVSGDYFDGCTFDIYRSTSPYSGYSVWMSGVASLNGVTDPAADGSTNYYYYAVTTTCGDPLIGRSPDQGAFNFSLEPGS